MTKRTLIILTVALGTLTLGMIPAAAQPPEGVPPVDVPVQAVDTEAPEIEDLPLGVPDFVAEIHAAIAEFVESVRECTALAGPELAEETADEDSSAVAQCLDGIFDETEFNSLGEQVSGIARNGFVAS